MNFRRASGGVAVGLCDGGHRNLCKSVRDYNGNLFCHLHLHRRDPHLRPSEQRPKQTLLYHFRYIIHLAVSRASKQVSGTDARGGVRDRDRGDDGDESASGSASVLARLPRRGTANSPRSVHGSRVTRDGGDGDSSAGSEDGH